MTSLIEIKKQKWIGIIFCIILLVLSSVFGIQKADVASNRLAVHFPRVMRKMYMLAWTFDEYRENQIPDSLLLGI